MIDIKHFPIGTKLNVMYTAPLTDYYGKKLPPVCHTYLGFYYGIDYIYPNKQTEVTPILFIDKLDFSEVEDFFNAITIQGNTVKINTDDIVLDFQKIKILYWDNTSFKNLPKTFTVNCGENFESLRGSYEFLSSYPGIFTLNSKSEKIISLGGINVSYMREVYINCDCKKLTSTPYNSTYSDRKDITYHSGFPNCKYASTGYYYDKFPNLTYDSILSIINNLYDFRGNGDATTTRTLKIHSNAMAMLTDADKAIAVNKGWTLTS